MAQKRAELPQKRKEKKNKNEIVTENTFLYHARCLKLSAITRSPLNMTHYCVGLYLAQIVSVCPCKIICRISNLGRVVRKTTSPLTNRGSTFINWFIDYLNIFWTIQTKQRRRNGDREYWRMWKDSCNNCADILSWRSPADVVKSHKTPRSRKTEAGTYWLPIAQSVGVTRACRCSEIVIPWSENGHFTEEASLSI